MNQQGIVRLYNPGVASIEMDSVERRKVGCRRDQGEEGCQRRGKVVWVVLGGGRGMKILLQMTFFRDYSRQITIVI